MSDVPAVPESVSWVTWLIGTVLTLVTGIFEYYRRKVDRIERGFLSKIEFKEYLRQVHEDRKLMHAENLAKLESIDGSMNRVHARIDQLYAREKDA